MNPQTAKTAYGMIHPGAIVGYNQGVSVDPNGRYDPVRGVWHANGREMVWNPRYRAWVITKGEHDPGNKLPSGYNQESAPQQQQTNYDPYAAERAAAAKAEADKKAQTEGAIRNTQKAIDSLGTERSTGYKNIEDSYSSLMGKYDKEASRNRADYDENTVTNTQNLSKNKQNALLAGAQGARGLRGTLSAMGALSGDGLRLANDAVATSVNQDIGGAADTYATNAAGLDKTWKNFEEDDEDRRAEARTTRTNQRTALEGQIAEKEQNFFQKMAELYGSIGNNDQANSYLDRAGGLNKTIAQKSRVQAPSFSAKAAAFTPDALQNYLAGAGDMTVTANAGDPTGGNFSGGNSILAGRRRRRDEEER